MPLTLEPAIENPPALPRTDSLRIIIPTFNAAVHWADLVAALTLQGIDAGQVIVVDSSSTDSTRELAAAAGYQVVQISKEEFGHGRTRQLAIAHAAQAEFLVFLTQDVVLESPEALRRLQEAFLDSQVGVAYGRQIARPGAGPIERHARVFNYPEASQMRTLESRTTLGFKAAFLSNSFAMYRRTALDAVGGFPDDVIFGEDSYVAAKMLLAGWKVAYQAQAVAIHSHALTIWQEFQRYFDIGVHHQREIWMLKSFGAVSGEGRRFVESELRYLRSHKLLMVAALVRTGTKLLAYRLGRLWRHLPAFLNRRLSSNPGFWQGR